MQHGAQHVRQRRQSRLSNAAPYSNQGRGGRGRGRR